MTETKLKLTGKDKELKDRIKKDLEYNETCPNSSCREKHTPEGFWQHYIIPWIKTARENSSTHPIDQLDDVSDIFLVECRGCGHMVDLKNNFFPEDTC